MKEREREREREGGRERERGRKTKVFAKREGKPCFLVFVWKSPVSYETTSMTKTSLTDLQSFVHEVS